MWTTPEKHTKKRETLRNANQHKTTRRAGYEKMYEKTLKGSIQNERIRSDEKLNKTKTLTTTARQKKAKEKALK